jgi:DNA mismatch repair protein MutS2
LREARDEIEAIIDGLKAKAASLSDQASVRLRSGDRLRVAGVSTGETGAARADARAALERVASKFRDEAPVDLPADAEPDQSHALEPGSRVLVGVLGLEGVVTAMHGSHAEVDVRGKRLRAATDDLRLLGGGAKAARVSVSVDLQPREGSLTELNVIGATVDDAIDRLGRFLDASIQTDLHELRIVHGHGTGQLRRAVAAFLKEHPLVARFETAPQNQGGGGATVVTLKD